MVGYPGTTKIKLDFVVIQQVVALITKLDFYLKQGFKVKVIRSMNSMAKQLIVKLKASLDCFSKLDSKL